MGYGMYPSYYLLPITLKLTNWRYALGFTLFVLFVSFGVKKMWWF